MGARGDAAAQMGEGVDGTGRLGQARETGPGPRGWWIPKRKV